MKTLSALLASVVLACAAFAADPADAIYHGGSIITVDDKNPTAEALAVKGGKIVAVGKKADVLAMQGEKTKLIDLKGRALLPGFIDSHSHLINVGVQAAVANVLPLPDGRVDSIATMQTVLKEWSASDAAKKILNGKLIIGLGYDDAQLKEQRHPTRHDLDAVSKELPVLVIHQSGHLASLNTKALEMCKITAETIDPPGGKVVREKDGKTPAGLLEETAWMPLLFQTILPAVTPGNERYFVEQGQLSYMMFGYTTAQEGRATADNLKVLSEAAKAGLLSLDVVGFPDPFLMKDAFNTKHYGKEYKSHFRVGGIKLNLDGSVQGKTAWLTKPYKVPPAGQDENYKGYPSLTDKLLFPVVKEAIQKKWQILSHCNGDAAIDQLLAAFKQAGTAEEVKASRPVVIHAQTAREDQLDVMQEYGVIPSFFNMHTYYWGDWHRNETLGEERAARISPSVSALKRKMIFTSHHDAPVALTDSIRILSSCVTRKTRTGVVLGKDQCIGMNEALKTLTIYAAYQYGEEASKGSLEVGKLADLVILSADPLKVDPDKIMDLKVMETIKEGVSIYQRK
jgi:predicted amidohydrolase YtcJ